MTHKEQLIKILNEANISTTEDPSTLTLEAKTTGVEGYCGAQTVFEFDENGTLTSVEIWDS